MTAPTIWKWATVTSTSPISIIIDGDDIKLPGSPDSLIDPAVLVPGDRVRCEITHRSVIVHGKAFTS